MSPDEIGKIAPVKKVAPVKVAPVKKVDAPKWDVVKDGQSCKTQMLEAIADSWQICKMVSNSLAESFQTPVALKATWLDGEIVDSKDAEFGAPRDAKGEFSKSFSELWITTVKANKGAWGSLTRARETFGHLAGAVLKGEAVNATQCLRARLAVIIGEKVGYPTLTARKGNSLNGDYITLTSKDLEAHLKAVKDNWKGISDMREASPYLSKIFHKPGSRKGSGPVDIG
jgi:hypothetical protein